MRWTRRSSFYVMLVVLGLLSLYVLWAYVPLVFLALVLVVVFEPLYEWFKRGVKHSGLAAVLTTITILLGVVGPLVLLVVLAAQQATVVVGQLSYALAHNQAAGEWTESFVADYWPGLRESLGPLIAAQQDQIYSLVQSAASGLGQVVTRGVVPAVASTAQGILDTVVFLFLLSYLFGVKQPLFERLRRLSWLAPEHHDRFVRRFEGVVRATMKGTLLVGLIQGSLGAVVMGLLGVSGAALWGLLMGAASILPMGSGLVWWPVGIGLLISGQWVGGVVWLVFCLVVVSSVDNVVRSKVLGSGEEAVPEVVTFLAILGGIRVFGFLGVILGPLIAALFLTALDLYEEQSSH